MLGKIRRERNAGFPDVLLQRRIASSWDLSALRHKGYGRDEMCIHGFRSMASTLLNEMGFNSDRIECQLSHDHWDAVRSAYNHAQYLPERRNMMRAWSDFLGELKAAALKDMAENSETTYQEVEQMPEEKPKCVFLRLPQVLEIFPISRNAWWQGCKDGRFPKPVKLGPKTTVWRKDEIERLAEEIASGSKKNTGRN